MSPTIQWSEELILGIKEMDEQHKELISRVNLLIQANNNEENKEQIEKLIEFLSVYIVEHFGLEERLQRQYQYPNYEVHRKEHFDFVKFVGEASYKYSKSNLCENPEDCNKLLNDLNTQLIEWITVHIGESDKKVAEHILKVHNPN